MPKLFKFKNLFFFCSLLLFVQVLHAQENMASVVKSLNEQPKLISGVSQIIETTYSGSDVEDAESPADTTIMLEGKKYYLKTSETTVKNYKSPLEVEMIKLGPEGEEWGSYHITYNEKGKMISFKTDLEMLSSLKTFSYDDQDRVVKVTENDVELAVLSYRDGFLLDKMTMDGGLMKMKTEAVELGDTLRYEMEMVMEGEMAMLMQGEGAMPREFTDVIVSDDNIKFMSFKEDQKTKKNILKSVNFYDKDLNILEEKYSNYKGENHWKYTYDDKGNVLKKTSMNSEEERIWEYDENGNMTKKIEDVYSTHFEYDANKNVTLKADKYDGGDSFSDFVLTQYRYN